MKQADLAWVSKGRQYSKHLGFLTPSWLYCWGPKCQDLFILSNTLKKHVGFSEAAHSRPRGGCGYSSSGLASNLTRLGYAAMYQEIPKLI